MQHHYNITTFSLFCYPLNHFFPKQVPGVAFLIVLFFVLGMISKLSLALHQSQTTFSEVVNSCPAALDPFSSVKS